MKHRPKSHIIQRPSHRFSFVLTRIIRPTDERLPATTDVDFCKRRGRVGTDTDGQMREQRAVHQRRHKTRQAARPLGIRVGFLKHNQAQPDHVSIRNRRCYLFRMSRFLVISRL